MNSYDQYLLVMAYMKANFSVVPVYFEDEEQSVDDFVVLGGTWTALKAYECNTKVYEVDNTYVVRCYSRYRGKSYRLASQVIEAYADKQVTPDLIIELSKLRVFTTMLEKDLFESTVVFNVKNDYKII